MKKELTIFLAFIFVSSLMVWLNVNRSGHKSWVGQSPPAFEAQGLDGETLHLTDLLGKKIVLINFWATHCPPCREEIPLLNELHTNLAGTPFAIVSLSEDDAASATALKAKIDAFKSRIPFDFPVYRDAEGMIATLFGTYQIPETYLIDEKGKVAKVFKGAFTASEAKELEKLIRKMQEKFP